MVFVLWAPFVYACFCGKPEVSTAFNRARVVFVGEVLEVIPPRGSDQTGEFVKDAHTIKFKVERTWKGAFWPEASVLARWNDCSGLQTVPRAGAKYLVYAEPVYPNDESRKEVMISSCTRTAPMSNISLDSNPFYRDSPAEDIRMLDTFIILSPRQKPSVVLWMKFLESDN